MNRLQNNVAIITGGAGGIGKAAGKKFASEGARVLLVDLHEGDLISAVNDIGSDQVSYCVADVTLADDNQKICALAKERYGGLDIFIANAGIEGKYIPFTETDEALYDQVMAVNVKGPFLGIKAAIPYLLERHGGSVIITASIMSYSGGPFISPYTISKHAVIGLMRSLAKEYGAANIRVNTVNPGFVDTRMMRNLESQAAPAAPEIAKQRLIERIPLGRYCQPSEVADLMLFLASDESRYVTGSTYLVDGGYLA